MLDYVNLTLKQLEEYSKVLTAKMGTPEADGKLPKSCEMAYDIFIHAPIPSIIVNITDKKTSTTYKRDEDTLHCTVEYKEQEIRLCFRFKADTEKKGIFIEYTDTPYNDVATRQVLLMYNTVQSLLIEPEQYMKQSKEVLPQNHKPHKPKNKKYKPPKKVTVYRLIDLDEEKQKRLEKTVKKREWRCLAWGVRGHYRHYKSGKTVFINAFTKGKNKEAYKGREYVLIRKEGKNNE